MVSVAKVLRTAFGGQAAPVTSGIDPTAEPRRLRDEERDAAVLGGKLPLRLFDVERTNEVPPKSPFYSRGL